MASTRNVRTAEEVSQGHDLSGKVAIVTGANVGIGWETARVLALRNAHVILACRSVQKGNEARQEFLASLGQDKADKIQVLELDLSSLESVQNFASAFKKLNLPLHLLILNAGAHFSTRTTTKEGFEGHFGVNHLAHFYLSQLLLPSLKSTGTAADPSRLIVVASSLHKSVPGDGSIGDPKTFLAETYDANIGYATSKLHNVMFYYELRRRLAGTNVVVNSLCPGLVRTTLARNVKEEEYDAFLQGISSRFNIPVLNIQQGAATTLYAAVSEEGGKGGNYFEYSRIDQAREGADDPAANLRLWELSQRLVDEFEQGRKA